MFTQELLETIRAWPRWTRLAALDVALQYRRSVLGPIWLSLNMLVMIVGMGLVYGVVFQADLESYIPYVASGLLAWGLLSAFFNDGAHTFTQNAHVIKNLRQPLLFFVCKSVTRQSIVAAHYFLVLVPIYILFPHTVNANLMLAVPALCLYLINGFAIVVIVGMVCSRFRDMPNAINNVLQVIFFLTPIFWLDTSLVTRRFIVDANPFYHFLTILRYPLIGQVPSLTNWLVVVCITFVLLIVAGLMFNRFRWQIVHTL